MWCGEVVDSYVMLNINVDIALTMLTRRIQLSENVDETV